MCEIMKGQMRKFDYSKYYKSCEETGEPVEVDKSVRLNLKGLMSYAKEQNISIEDVPIEKKMQFVIRL